MKISDITLGEGGYPDPEKRGGVVSKKFFSALRASVWSKGFSALFPQVVYFTFTMKSHRTETCMANTSQPCTRVNGNCFNIVYVYIYLCEFAKRCLLSVKPG